MDDLIQELRHSYTNDKYERFCVDFAIQQIELAKDAMTTGMKNPKKFYEDMEMSDRIARKALPAMVVAQQLILAESGNHPPGNSEN